MAINLTLDEAAEVFEYLDILRESGEINMFGASFDVEKDLGYTKPVARYAVSLWMQTFDGETSAYDRALKAVG